MGDSGKFSGIKVLVIILAAILIFAIAFYTITDGIVETVKSFFKNLVTKSVEGVEVAWDKIKEFLGISIVKNGMYIYSIDSGQATSLKQQIEAQGIDTDKAGITEVLLRKMLLTQAVTSSTQDTLCVAEVTEKEILQNTGYSDVNKYLKSLEKKENAKDIFPIKNYNYPLYYITDYFFYFKDSDNMIGQGNNKYYLGIKGTTTIVKEDNDEFKYVSNDDFKKALEEYNKLNDDQKDNDNNQVRKDLLDHYTINSEGQMIGYKIIKNKNLYSYTFTNDNSSTKIDKKDIEENNSSYEVITYPINIQNSIDSNIYEVSIELLMNLLNISASPQYLDEFMDYAIEKNEVTIKAYPLQNEQISYSKETYNIEDNFIFELYDIDSSETMKAYKPIVYDRKYNDTGFENSIDRLDDFENITRERNKDFEKIIIDLYNAYLKTDDEEDVDKIENIDNFDSKLRNYYKVNYYAAKDNKALSDKELKEALEAEESKDEPIFKMENDDDLDKFIAYIQSDFKSKKTLSDCLLLSYDPAGTFSLGNVTVEQITKNEKYETSWQFEISSISTWYGNITYAEPDKTTEYDKDGTDCTKEEFDNFNDSKLTRYESKDNEKDKTKIYISEDRARRS